MRRAHWLFAALLGWILVDEARIVAFGGGDLGLPFDRGARNVVMGIAAAACLLRAVRVRHERAAWSLIGAGLLAWTAGDVYYSVVLWDLEVVPVPSPADIGYLLLPPLLITGVALLVRARTQQLRGALLADGAGAALAVAAVGAAIVFDPILDAVEGNTVEVMVNLAYPLTDLLLLAVVVGALASRGWAVDRTWLCLGVGALAFWFADSEYLVLSATDEASPEAWYDMGWTLGLVLFAWAAYQPAGAARASRERLRTLLMPLAFGCVALGLLLYGTFTHITPLAVVLAAVAIIALGVRLALTFRQNVALMHRARDEAFTDALTGLGNRRALAQAVEDALDRRADDGRSWVLALFDLDGFKHYNDSFGHPAGDSLLVRLGANLESFLGDDGQAFRMGGDEFCALMRSHRGAEPALVARAGAALTEHGEGFSVTCSHGLVILPGEAGTAPEALRIADQRMYADKRVGRSTPGRESRDVLLRALAERNPELSRHLADVAGLAGSTARALGLDGEQLEHVVQAAELHDVGKVAIPDTILNKPGPLDAGEWAFVRQHTLAGERIVAAAPALIPVGRLVRSSHERWDGGGYPDKLAAEAIPLGARIIAVCDAYDAMTAERPYSQPMESSEALAELRRCAGTQFDPRVVEAFARALTSHAVV